MQKKHAVAGMGLAYDILERIRHYGPRTCDSTIFVGNKEMNKKK